MKKKFRPESLMMSYGYRPEWSEGAIKCPIFATSTFVFNSAEEGKAFFEVAYGKRDKEPNEKIGLIYSRINNPDLEILENRLCLWDRAEEAAVFESGMSAITTVMLEYLKPGDLILYSMPIYGGTDHFISHFLPSMGVNVLGFGPDESKEDIIFKIKDTGHSDRLKLIFLETPANPTNDLIDIEMCSEIASFFSSDDNKVVTAVDNTYMGPLWQHPLEHGADIVIYSATKYIGGHSDVIAGAVLGSEEIIKRIKTLRTFLGNMAGPWTGWLLLRSLETLKVRMDKQTSNAQKVAGFLDGHPLVKSVHYLGLLNEGSRYYKIYKKQCSAPGAMVSFEIKGGEKEAFTFLNNLPLFKLAVSLGSTESLAQHPKTMTHAGLEEEHQLEIGITDSLVRLSIGVEHPDDIISALDQALKAVEKDKKAEEELMAL
ncbi:MAG: cystathionine gamma-synthase family protein [Saprospiraceae bacterium]|nr:cystathionine gamma-synthase family protein [Saprospiraceae bacterium]